MNYSAAKSQHILGGTIRIFLAEALLLPTGIVTAGFLTRQFGPEGYGLFTLAATLIAWVEWSVTSVFTRTTIKFVGEADDWHPVATTVLRLHLAVGCAAMLLVWLCAYPIANLLDERAIAMYLILFAIDIPLFCLAYAHRSILVGVGGFNQRANATAGRWIARLLLILLLVELGLSIPGAILSTIGASIVELAISRCYIRPSLLTRSSFPARQLANYAVPLFMFALSMRLYDKLDLFALKVLGGTAAEAGFYGAAQNLSLIPGIFSLSFSPLLLSSLSRTLHNGDIASAKKMSQNALRAIAAMLTVAGIIAGAAPEIVQLIFGNAFLPTAPLLAILIFGAIALAMISTTTAILTAASKPNWTFVLTAPLVPLAVVGYTLVIPRWGAIGAAWVFTLCATFGAAVTVGAVYHLLRVLPPASTVARSCLICASVYTIAAIVPTQGLLLLLKLFGITLLIPLFFWLLGEFSQAEIYQIILLIKSKLKHQKSH
ncbi:lipopolysaccharide biosynthesis protein [Chroococcidiopsis sp. TS-821]|uniref:lipopolysaccharide biosynthesis protein n=1 Tax=Chroococcidiopsis sp. TS-821 TaxID=1378066 RepID=UPI000CEE7A14|nr:oligosaccharide flippase family protein [Chroococcidiopsis sp. TS-821]PPS45649.1 teichoic acid transporter [Chroococcidiopsis sp. TS-821]